MKSSIWRHLPPVRAILLGFTVVLWMGVLLLMLPISKRGPGGASFLDAFFSATSAICVTGLSTVDVSQYWSPFGHVVLIVLVQVGGFGVMTMATLVGLAVLGKLSLRSRLTAVADMKAEGLEQTGRLVLGVLRITVAVEVATALLLAGRFWLGYGYSLPKALWYGVFHSIASFNNAGFSLYTDSMMGFVGDPWICLPIMAGIVIGGLGFPVLMQLGRHARNTLQWSVNTRLVLLGSVVLLLAGAVAITALEWANAATMGPLTWDTKLLAGAFQSVQARTAGFNSVDMAALHPATRFVMDALMFIGGGPAGTSGGIKVTTFLVLFFIMWTEVRGDTSVVIVGKQLPASVARQAIAVTLLAGMLVAVSTIAIMISSGVDLDRVLFEVISAFGTVGLSANLTPSLDTFSKLVLCLLMYIGRLGPITFASALALRQRKRLYQLPEERPIIG